jgi:hypothetical protein
MTSAGPSRVARRVAGAIVTDVTLETAAIAMTTESGSMRVTQ